MSILCGSILHGVEAIASRVHSAIACQLAHIWASGTVSVFVSYVIVLDSATMGVSVEQWRVKIGAFMQPPVRPKFRPSVLTFSRLQGRMIGLLFTVFTVTSMLAMQPVSRDIMQDGDVEANPGPPPDPPAAAKAGTPSQRQTRQTTLTQSGGIDTSALILGEIKGLRDDFNQKINFLHDTINSKFDELKQENAMLRSELKEAKDMNTKLVTRLDTLEDKSRRNNLVFWGIKEDENSSGTNTETIVETRLKAEKIDIQNIDFRANRIGKYGDKDRPILGTYQKLSRMNGQRAY